MKTNWEPHQHRILVKVDETEKVSDGGIVLMEETVAQEQNQQVLATILKVGPSAVVDENLVPGTRVLIAKWGGATIPGEESKLLRIINDEDINGFEVEA